MNQIDGVGQTEIRGGLKRVVCVDVDLNRLNAYSININDIMKAIEKIIKIFSVAKLMKEFINTE